MRQTFKHVAKHYRQNAESGQAILLIALMMVGLIAFLGLGIDGGGLLLLQRNAQNAADAAVLAATYARCTESSFTEVANAARAAAADNGFNNDGITNTVEVNSPPLEGARAGNSEYVEVKITADKPSYFIQVVYRGPLRVSVRAVGYCRPPFNSLTYPGVAAFSETCQNSFNWTGSSSEFLTDIWSNNEAKFGGGGQGNTVNGDVSSVASPIEGNNVTFNGSNATGVEPLEDLLPIDIDDYVPGGPKAVAAAAAGLYTAIDGDWNPNNSTVFAGLYYVNGDISLPNHPNIDNSIGVTFVSTGKITANNISMNYYIDGLLMFTTMDTSSNCGSNAMTVSGSSDTWYGIIYAPHGGMQISGSQTTIIGGLFGNTIDMSGSDLYLEWDPDLLPPRPPLIEVAE